MSARCNKAEATKAAQEPLCAKTDNSEMSAQSSACGNPGVPPKGILSGTRFNVGDKIRYSCVTGYVLDGHPQLTCITNAANMAVWDFPVPICRGKALQRSTDWAPSCQSVSDLYERERLLHGLCVLRLGLCAYVCVH
ncbi:hypothetical protein ACEWY4_024036 [Coilia grayii]|uniref:Sushi domain-containing protein n=1 Tax=Coilia grayii TaxID=363190 RepID=A0ABD1IZ75_9TELE